MAFFQKQKNGLGCGRIAINNILGREQFIAGSSKITPEELASYETQLPDKIDMKGLCTILEDQFKAYTNNKVRIFECSENENYNFPLLQSVMGMVKYKLINSYHFNNPNIYDKFIKDENVDSINRVYIFNLGNGSHWTSAKKIGNLYYYFDGLSINAKPEEYNAKRDLLNSLKTKKITSAYAFDLTDTYISPLSQFKEIINQEKSMAKTTLEQNGQISKTTYENCSVNNGTKYSASVQLYRGKNIQIKGGKRIKSCRFYLKRKNSKTKKNSTDGNIK
jgi:hypothetical protein